METRNNEKEYGFGLIMDHLAGTTSDDSRKQLDEWRRASDENEQLFVWMEKMWRSLSLSERDKTFDHQRAYRMFRERVEAETARVKEFSTLNSQFSIKKIASYAAVLIPLVTLSYFTYRYFTIAPGQITIPLLSEITVPAGSKTQLSLQDGSKGDVNK
ncbi:MAG: hypothetical protein LBI03_10600 [Clostridiales bacterium]|nr:hypothetical protein [Clostridiales bacterium]